MQKSWKQRNLATKQQKRCFGCDKAKISELAANRKKNIFFCAKAELSVTAANKQENKRLGYTVRNGTIRQALENFVFFLHMSIYFINDVNGVPYTSQDYNEDLAIFSTKIDKLNVSVVVAILNLFSLLLEEEAFTRSGLFIIQNLCATNNVKYLLMCGDVQASPGPCRNSTGRPYSDNHRTSKNILRCMSLNARSIYNKLNEFHDSVKMRNVDMAAVTETWPHQRILDTEILDSNYINSRRDRPTRFANDNSTILYLLITSVPEFVRHITILSGEFLLLTSLFYWSTSSHWNIMFTPVRMLILTDNKNSQIIFLRM